MSTFEKRISLKQEVKKSPVKINYFKEKRRHFKRLSGAESDDWTLALPRMGPAGVYQPDVYSNF